MSSSLRGAIVAALVMLPALAHAADGGRPPDTEIDPKAPACALLSNRQLEPYLGAPVQIRESRSSPNGVSSCHWQGARSDAFVDAALFPQGSAGIAGPQPTPEALFEATMDAQRRSVGEDYLRPLSGVGDRAYRTEFKDNPTNAHSAFVLRRGASLTLNTYGLGPEPMIALTKAVAGKM